MMETLKVFTAFYIMRKLRLTMRQKVL